MKKYRPVLGALALLLTASSPAQGQNSEPTGTQGGQWRWHDGDKAASKYSELDQINRDNFAQLKVAWIWESIDNVVKEKAPRRVRPQEFKSTPLMINGVLYTSTSFSQVAAIDAGTGSTLWSYDPESWKAGRPANIGYIHRGVSYWADGDDERIIVPTGHSQLIALNAKTGQPIPEFGRRGIVNLLRGLQPSGTARVATHQVNTPPIICRDVIIVGSVIMDRPGTQKFVRGDIRGFDVRTGEKLWQFHSIPQEGEFGQETWENDSWKITGNTNVWSLMSCDEELGYVYLPFGAPTNDFYGGHRHGDGLFGNSLVCLNAETGERVWHFQTVHHDLWDFDLPCAPNLVDIIVDGKPIKAVAQVGKTGFCYVFDRVTGEPVWPIEERDVPQSTVPGEKTSPTQPFPTKPPPFSNQGLTLDDVIDYTPEIKAAAMKIVKQYEYGPLFTPGSEKGTLTVPGDGGGANWMGAVFDPQSQLLYVPSISYSYLNQLVKPDPARSDHAYVILLGHPQGPYGLPLFKGPYSRITAIDLSNGTHAWMQPMGEGIETHPRLKDLNLPRMGTPGWAFPLVTKTLLIAAHNGSLYAIDKATGEILGEIPFADENGESLGNVTGMPMTFMHEGHQHIALALTKGGRRTAVGISDPDNMRIVAYRLP